jgi:hypothetical protein
LKDYPHDVILSKRFSCWGWGTWADRWNNINNKLEPFNNPYNDYSRVPDDAGFDLAIMAKDLLNKPGSTWAVPVAITCLKLDLLHALTKYYLSQNIGIESGTHGNPAVEIKLSKYFLENNQTEDRIPVKFPELSFNREVGQAIKDYINGMYGVGLKTKMISAAINFVKFGWSKQNNHE